MTENVLAVVAVKLVVCSPNHKNCCHDLPTQYDIPTYPTPLYMDTVWRAVACEHVVYTNLNSYFALSLFN